MGTPAQLQLGSYSTSEQATRHKWVDGKIIYQKTIVCVALPNNGEKSFPHGVPNIDNPIKIEGMVFNTSSGIADALQINSLRPSFVAGSIGAYFSKTDIIIGAGTDRTNSSARVTIYYTKT